MISKKKFKGLIRPGPLPGTNYHPATIFIKNPGNEHSKNSMQSMDMN